MIAFATPPGRALVETYVAHVFDGIPMREIARRKGLNPSTIMRRVRRVEADLDRNEALDFMLKSETERKEFALKKDKKNLDADAAKCRFLLSLLVDRDVCAVTSRSPDMATAIIVRHIPQAAATTLAKVPRDVIFTAAAQGWVTMLHAPKFDTYRISDAGRRLFSSRAAQGSTPAPRRRGIGPALAGLARRRLSPARADSRYLSGEMVSAAAMFFEDFEVAALESPGVVDWRAAIAGRSRFNGPALQTLPDASRRAVSALAMLGPDLGEIVLSVVCEGVALEEFERRTGWSSRSAKVVLRIALSRLAEHYGTAHRSAA